VGSGLILLVIVGAWLAVLVPMALRSHDANSSLGTVDKFHDAMRVLARRDALARIAQTPAVSAQDGDQRPALTLAARRLRVLTVLVVAAGVLLLGAVVLSWWLLLPQLVVAALGVAYVVHLRRDTQREAQRRSVRREQRAEARAVAARVDAPPAPMRIAAPAPVALAPQRRRDVPAHVAGIPGVMPARHVVDPSAGPLSLVPRPEPTRPRGAIGQAWSPVPVPVPTYVTAPKAPRRFVDLPRAVVLGAEQADADVQRRRAAND